MIVTTSFSRMCFDVLALIFLRVSFFIFSLDLSFVSDLSSGYHDDDDVDDDDNTDSSDEGRANIDDCESHLQDFDVVVSNFKERVRAKWNEPAFQRGFKSFKKITTHSSELCFNLPGKTLKTYVLGRSANMAVKSQYNQLPWQGGHIELLVGV